MITRKNLSGNDSRIRIVTMSVLQQVQNSTVFVDITELVIPLKADTMYYFEIRGKNSTNTGTSNDIQYSWTVPSGADIRVSTTGGNTFIMIQGGVSTGLINATINQETTYSWGIIIMGSTPGNFQPQFTQFVAGNITRIHAGTCLKMIELGAVV